MANRVTVWWQGEEYDAVRQNGAAAEANTGSTWQVLHDGAALTSFAAEPGEARQIVDGARVRGARVRDHEERQAPRGRVGVDRRREVVDADPEPVVRGDHPELIGTEPEMARGAGDGRVGLVAGIGHDPRRHRPDDRLPGAGDGCQVRRRPAGHEHAGGLRGVADPLAEPVEDGQLQLARTGGFPPGAGIDVGCEGRRRRAPLVRSELLAGEES